jgi:hypothetical protein
MLVLSTLPHYLSVLPLLPNYYYVTNDSGAVISKSATPSSTVTNEYVNTILIASTLSVLYHFSNESLVVAIPDYLAAFIWLLYDLYFGWYFVPQYFQRIVILNALVVALNWSITKSNPNYEMLHSVWHIGSAAKCYYVSLLVSRMAHLKIQITDK